MLRWPAEPMRAAPAADLPSTPARPLTYEPKWDGFRALAWRNDEGVRLQSRHGRDLSRYFPDLCAVLSDQLVPGVLLDGELIVWDPPAGRTSFDLLQRRFTAGRRITTEAAAHPAHFVAFDILRDTRGRELLDQPLSSRRRRLQRLLADAAAPLTLCPQTADQRTARRWMTEWAATGVEGVVVKPADGRYRNGEAGWIKVKSRHSEEYIVGGLTGPVDRPVSLLLGRYDERGVFRFAGMTHRIRAVQRGGLAGLTPMVFRGDRCGHPWPCPLPPGWTADMAERAALPYTQVEPDLVVEVETDISRDGPFGRLRHHSRFLRVRPDLKPGDIRCVGATPLAAAH